MEWPSALIIFFNTPEFTYTAYIYRHEDAERLNKKAKRKRRWARAGMFLLFAGFSLQLAANTLT